MLQNFCKLYQLKSSNKWYTWEINLELLSDGRVKITTRNGYEDGKKTEHNTIITEGKQKRSIVEQANMIAIRKWENKKKEGYQTDMKSDKALVFNKNTFKPMLANNYEKHSNKIKFPCIVQPKLDGFRCIAYLDDNDNVVLLTRTSSILKHFSSIKNNLKSILSKNVIFDGEIYSEDYEFNEIVGFVHLKELHEQSRTIESNLHYYVFDCYITNKPDESFENRLKLLKTFNLNSFNNIKLVENNIVTQLDDINLYLKIYMKSNYEGVMIRNINSKYLVNKRSSNLLKLKTFYEKEFKIIGAKEANGNDKGTVIWICENENGSQFSVRQKGSRELRRKLFKDNKKYIGKNLTVIYQELTPDKITRFPVGKSIRSNY